MNMVNVTIAPGPVLSKLGRRLGAVRLALLAAFPAHARLKIRPVFIDEARPPADMTGGGISRRSQGCG